MKVLEVIVSIVSVIVGAGVVIVNTLGEYLKELVVKSIMEIK